MTHEDIIKMAQQSGADTLKYWDTLKLERFAALVAEKEREACAKEAEDYLTKGRSPLGIWVAKAIRARGKK